MCAKFKAAIGKNFRKSAEKEGYASIRACATKGKYTVCHVMSKFPPFIVMFFFSLSYYLCLEVSKCHRISNTPPSLSPILEMISSL